MSKWREIYKVHAAADEFPMMSDEELADLGQDIKDNGLKHPIIFQQGERDEDGKRVLLDGRNRLEAIERAGIEARIEDHYRFGDPVAHIIGLNIKRRHMSPEKIAETLVRLAKIQVEKETPPRGEVSKGGRGKRHPVKAKALELNKALPKETQVGERTIERHIAKAEGRAPKPARPKWARSEEPKQHRSSTSPLPKPRSGPVRQGLETARKYYLDQLRAEPDVDLDLEHRTISEALREIAGARLAVGARQ